VPQLKGAVTSQAHVEVHRDNAPRSRYARRGERSGLRPAGLARIAGFPLARSALISSSFYVLAFFSLGGFAVFNLVSSKEGR